MRRAILRKQDRFFLNSGLPRFPFWVADEFEKGPGGAEVVAGAEFGVVEANDGAIGVFAECTDTWPNIIFCFPVFFVGFVVAHILCEGAVDIVDEREVPIAGGGEFFCSFEVVGSAERDSSNVGDSVHDGAKDVGPVGAITAGFAHVVDDEKFCFITEEVIEHC